jgi:hypothetical protein
MPGGFFPDADERENRGSEYQARNRRILMRLAMTLEQMIDPLSTPQQKTQLELR